MLYVDEGLVAARTAAEAGGLVKIVGSILPFRSWGSQQIFLESR
jgi:hypothetical protein